MKTKHVNIYEEWSAKKNVNLDTKQRNIDDMIKQKQLNIHQLIKDK
jgi:hypothetical protein